ncbi:thiamine kinase [Brenneria roseae subsp. americana]|uniref:Thiamine kinase n=1 Tax=Brenneria roseae subsp. americana TaxID=1508507 RepID=A0A2U1TXN5_9GAMM|nr:thiamine kinase [Brenneria roseae]PWC14178.1 thiamine kinase [Brenneria roseae subsp. americana]
MDPFNIKQQLTELVHQFFPAVSTAGFHFEPISGLSSESWRISGPDIEWLARPQSALGRQTGTDRQREFHLLRQMAAAGLAPRPLLWRRDWLIIEWVPGRIATADEFSALLTRGALAGCLSRIHQQPCSGYPLDLRTLFSRHWQQMDPRRRSPALLRWHQHFQRLPLPAWFAYAPLHLDVHADNVLLTSNGMMLIDWEYASDGDIAFEMAFIFRANQMDTPAQINFLETYQRHRPGFSVERLYRHVVLWLPWVDYLVLMWFEVRWQQTRQDRFLQALPSLRRQLGLN